MTICKKYEKIRKNTKKYEFEILGVCSYFFELDPMVLIRTDKKLIFSNDERKVIRKFTGPARFLFTTYSSYGLKSTVY